MLTIDPFYPAGARTLRAVWLEASIHAQKAQGRYGEPVTFEVVGWDVTWPFERPTMAEWRAAVDLLALEDNYGKEAEYE